MYELITLVNNYVNESTARNINGFAFLFNTFLLVVCLEFQKFLKILRAVFSLIYILIIFYAGWGMLEVFETVYSTYIFLLFAIILQYLNIYFMNCIILIQLEFYVFCYVFHVTHFNFSYIWEWFMWRFLLLLFISIKIQK